MKSMFRIHPAVKSKLISQVILLIGILTFSCILSPKSDAQIIIVNKSNPTIKISRAELRNIFIGNTVTWSFNQKVQIADYNVVNELRTNFCTEYLGYAPNRINMMWIKISLSGKASAPKIFRNEDEIKKYVSENEGAISYISNKSNLPSNVKVITID